MRYVYLAALAALLVDPAQQTATGVEQGTLRLHYVQKPIGYERYSIARDGDTLQLTDDFDFTDRGGNVHLTAALRTALDHTPIHFTAKGKSYRFVNVDSDVAVDGQTAMVRADGAETRVSLKPPFYTVDGYAPFAAQMLMLRYWKQHGRPRTIHTVPGLPIHDVLIEARGRDSVRVGSAAVALDRYTVDGVVWGRETIWLDDREALAAAVTRAGGLHFQAVPETLAPAVGTFVELAARDGIADLKAITARLTPIKSGSYAIVGATIVDGTGRPPIPDGVVIVREGRIADVGPRASVSVPSSVPTL